MKRLPSEVRMRRRVHLAEASPPWVPLSPTVAVPSAFETTFEFPDLERTVELAVRVVDGDFIVDRLTLSASDGASSLTPVDLEVLVALRPFALLPNAVFGNAWTTGSNVPSPITREGDDGDVWVPVAMADEQTQREAVTAIGPVQPRRGRRVRRDELEEVARIYTVAAGDGAPTMAVKRALDLSYRTAARRVEQARDAGLLGKTTKGKAGEAKKGPRS